MDRTIADRAPHRPGPSRPARRRLLAGLAGSGAAAAAGIGAWRAALLEPAGGPAVSRIVAVYRGNSDDSLFLMGARLAVSDVNAAGGIQLALDAVEERGDGETATLDEIVRDTLRLAAAIVRRPSVLAVVGHDAAATVVSASSVYDRAGRLFLATHATTTSLTQHGFSFVFALQPSGADRAAVMARYAQDQGLRRLVVLNDETSYGLEAGSQFLRFSALGGAEILHRGFMTSSHRSIDRLLLFILGNGAFSPREVDAFFLATSSVHDTIHFIRRARQLGLNMPILGDNLFSTYLDRQVGSAAMKGVAAVSTYAVEDREWAEASSFGRRFQAAFGTQPDMLAAIGYDSIQLLAYAVRRAGSRDPRVLADTLRVLRYEAPFTGVTGQLVFDTHGLVTDTDIYVVRHDGTGFETVATYNKPRDTGDNAIGRPPVLASP